jgi:hypothetical protein
MCKELAEDIDSEDHRDFTCQECAALLLPRNSKDDDSNDDSSDCSEMTYLLASKEGKGKDKTNATSNATSSEFIRFKKLAPEQNAESIFLDILNGFQKFTAKLIQENDTPDVSASEINVAMTELFGIGDNPHGHKIAPSQGIDIKSCIERWRSSCRMNGTANEILNGWLEHLDSIASAPESSAPASASASAPASASASASAASSSQPVTKIEEYDSFFNKIMTCKSDTGTVMLRDRAFAKMKFLDNKASHCFVDPARGFVNCHTLIAMDLYLYFSRRDHIKIIFATMMPYYNEANDELVVFWKLFRTKCPSSFVSALFWRKCEGKKVC